MTPLLGISAGTPEAERDLSHLVGRLRALAEGEGLTLVSRGDPLFSEVWLHLHWFGPPRGYIASIPNALAARECMTDVARARAADGRLTIQLLDRALGLIVDAAARQIRPAPTVPAETPLDLVRSWIYYQAVLHLPDELARVSSPLGAWSRVLEGAAELTTASLLGLKPGDRKWPIIEVLEALERALHVSGRPDEGVGSAIATLVGVVPDRAELVGTRSRLIDWLASNGYSPPSGMFAALSHGADVVDLALRRTWDEPVRIVGGDGSFWLVASTASIGAYISAVAMGRLGAPR